MLYKANKVRQTIQQWYYFYELNTNLCMLEPWEKTLFSKSPSSSSSYSRTP